MNEYNFNNSATDLGTDDFTFTTTKEVLLEQMKIKLRGTETTSAVTLNVLKGATNVYSSNKVIGIVDDYVTFDMDKTILDSSSTYTFNLVFTDAQVYVDNKNDAENPEDVALTISSEKMWNCKIMMQNIGWLIGSDGYPVAVGGLEFTTTFDWSRNRLGEPLNQTVWKINSDINEGYPYSWLAEDWEKYDPSSYVTHLQYIPIVI